MSLRDKNWKNKLNYTLGSAGGYLFSASKNKKINYRPFYPLCVIALLAINAAPAVADTTLPTEGHVTSGAASINSAGGTMTIQQSTQKAAINWKSFSVGSDASVNFIQPSSSSITLNRVTGSEKSIINGSVTANGQIFLLNSNGVLIGNGGSINASGVVASTMELSDSDFNNANYSLNNKGSLGEVINRGTITSTDGGYVVLAGQKVSNEGIIHARLGHAALAAGEKVSLNFNGDSLVNVSVDQGAINALVENKQAIYADGGTVTMTAKAADKLLENVVNNEGIVQARSISKKNGVIRLNGGLGGVVKNSGTLDASGKNDGETGGTITTEGNFVHQAGNAVVDASGHSGGGEILLGGDYQGQNPNIQNANYNLTEQNVLINADAIQSGNGGRIILWADRNTLFRGRISAKGGRESGNGGFVEVSGKDHLDFRGDVDTTAINGETGLLYLDPANITIQGGSGDGAADGTATFMGTVTAGTVAGGDAGPSTIYQSELQGIAATTNISVAATNSITINALSGGNLNLAQNAGRSVTFTAGAGGITMANLANTITTAGAALNFTATGGVALGNLSTNGGLITINVGGASQVSGNISGTGTAVTKTGAGLLELSGNNTYTGNTTISTGTLSAGSNTAFGTGTVSIGAGTTLQSDGTARTLANNVSFVNTSAIGGTSNLTLTGTLTNIQAGNSTLNVNNTATTTLGNINLSNSATNRVVTLGGNGNVTVNGIIANGSTSTASALSKSGTGTLILGGANTYGGATTLSAGTTQIRNNAAFGTGTLTFAGGSIASNSLGTAHTLANTITRSGNTTFSGTAALSFSGTMTHTTNTTLTNNMSGNLSFQNVNLSNSATNRAQTFTGTGTTIVNGVIANGSTSTASTVTKTGTGTLRLNGANTYGGTTTLTQGTIEAATNTALGTGAISLNGGSLSAIGGGRTFANALTLNNNSSFSGSNNITFTNTLTNTNNRTITNNLTAGTLTFGNINISNSATSRTLTFAGNGNTTVTGVIANGSTSTASAITKTGTGTLQFNNANTYDGATTISAGTLRYGANNTIDAGTVTVNNGGTLDLNGFSDTIGALNINSGATGGTVMTGAGTLTLGGNITSTGGGTNALISGNLNLGASNRNVATTNAADGLTISANISGARSLTKTGNGSLLLSGNNTHTLGTTLSTGTLDIGSNTAFGTGTFTISGGTIRGDGTARTLSNAISLGASTTFGGTSDLTFTGLMTNTLSGNPTITNNNTGTTTFGAIDLSNSGTNRTLVFGGSGNTIVNGIIANGSTSTASAVTKVGAGTLTLNGANTYAGTNNLNSGTVVLGNNTALGTGNIALAGAIIRGDGTARTLSNNLDQSVSTTFEGPSSLTFSGIFQGSGDHTITNNLSAGTLTFGNINISNSGTNRTLTFAGNGDTTVNGVIANGSSSTASAITKSGTGTLRFNNANTYGGATTISDGVLALGGNNSLPNNTVLTLAAGTNFNTNGFNFSAASIAADGDVDFGTGSIITTSGNQIYNGAVTGNNTTLSSSGAGNISATNAGNDFTGNLSGTTTGTFNIRDGNNLALGNLSAASIDARALGGDITLNGSLNASNTSGTSINLVASDDFINNTGAGALVTGAGSRWLIYSSTPLDDTFGGLARNFKQYNAVFGDAILGTGNGSIYTIAPTVTFGLTGTVSKPFDGNTTATLTAANYNVTGAIDGDAVTSNQPVLGNYDSATAGTAKTVTATGLSIASATNGAATIFGYGLSSTSASGAVGVITGTGSGGGSSGSNTNSNTQNITSVILTGVDPLFTQDRTRPPQSRDSASYDLFSSFETNNFTWVFPDTVYGPNAQNYLTEIALRDGRVIYKGKGAPPSSSQEDSVIQ